MFEFAQILRKLRPNIVFLIITDSFFCTQDSLIVISSIPFIKFIMMSTTRSNKMKEIVKHLKIGLKKSEFKILTNPNKNLCITVYNDNAICLFVSNFNSSNKMVKQVLKTRKTFLATHQPCQFPIKWWRIQERPQIVAWYNNWMNCVDMFDLHLCYKLNQHRNKKWTNCFFNIILQFLIFLTMVGLEPLT